MVFRLRGKTGCVGVLVQRQIVFYMLTTGGSGQSVGPVRGIRWNSKTLMYPPLQKLKQANIVAILVRILVVCTELVAQPSRLKKVAPDVDDPGPVAAAELAPMPDNNVQPVVGTGNHASALQTLRLVKVDVFAFAQDTVLVRSAESGWIVIGVGLCASHASLFIWTE